MKTSIKKLRPPFKIHGGKFYLSPWVISLFPEDYASYDYVEPFAGAASVLLNKERSEIEVLNDIDIGVVQIFRALRDEPADFINRIKKITYSERVFKRELGRSKGPFEDYLDHAVNEFVIRRMSRGGLKKAYGWSDRLRGGQPGDVNAWMTMQELLPDIAERMKGVRIYNKTALEVIAGWDSQKAILYCDPPYDPDSRVSKDAYGHEMTTEDHVKLSEDLHRVKAKVLLSGYNSTLYEKLYDGWRCEKKSIANHSSQKKTKEVKVECCWMNY